VKVVLADENGDVVDSARVASGLVFGPAGHFEHDAAQAWWEIPRDALRSVLGAHGAGLAGGQVGAVAVSAMMPSVCAVDDHGRPLGPGLLYGDSRGSAGGDGARDGPTGSDPTASDEMGRLTSWVAASTRGASGYWPAQAVANGSLGGKGVIDLASAFAAGPLFNGSGWDAARCEAAGFSASQMPEVAVFGEAIGAIGPGGLGPAGLPGRSSAEVILGAGSVDGLCEQLVAGAVHAGDVLITLGSTLVVWLCASGWPDEVPGLWRVPHVVGGKAMVGGASNAGGMWADWVDRVLRPDVEVGPGPSEGLRPGHVPLWWPWVKGERVPWHDPLLRVRLGGADLSDGPAALRRAAFEATGFVTRRIVEMASACGTEPKRYIVSGGGSARPAWLQALADVLGAPVLPTARPEGAALGAAFLARVAAGLEPSIEGAARWARWSAPVEPRREWVEAAAERYELWGEGLPRARLPVAHRRQLGGLDPPL